MLAFQTLLPSLSPANALQAAPNLQQSLVTYLGGAMADPIWFVLGIVGVLSIPALSGRFGKLLVAWVGTMSLGVLFVAPPTNLLQSRMIYDVPLQIFAAIGLVAIIRSVHSSLEGVGPRRGLSKDAAALVLLLSVVGLALGFALEYVGFLYQ
jgi:hypothetical protein